MKAKGLDRATHCAQGLRSGGPWQVACRCWSVKKLFNKKQIYLSKKSDEHCEKQVSTGTFRRMNRTWLCSPFARHTSHLLKREEMQNGVMQPDSLPVVWLSYLILLLDLALDHLPDSNHFRISIFITQNCAARSRAADRTRYLSLPSKKALST